MIEALVSGNARDFRQRYEGTYGWFTTSNNRRLLVKLREVLDAQVSFIDSDGNDYHAIVDSGVGFDFIPVTKKLSNSRNSMLYSRRMPARQWRRGVCGDNTRITDVLTNRALPVNFNYLNIIYNNTVDTRLELEGICSKTSSRQALALSDNFGVVATPGNPDWTVVVYNEPIGVFNINQRKLKVNKLFAQEVKDVLLRNKYNLIVEVAQ